MNDNITAPEVRLIGEDGQQIGVTPIKEALEMAEDAGLDLVEMVPNADPPVCRIMDHGKFLYAESKKKHAAKKKQQQVHVKEIKFRPGTEKGDYDVKLRNLKRFLTHGDRVKVTLRFRGREMAHQELGMDLLKRVEADLGDLGTVEQFPRMEGRVLTMLVAPKR
ncbi:MAG: translation initiation factor IF-3 [Gammaproteobacteria bacterium]|jgi:translation initiation factor IF-3